MRWLGTVNSKVAIDAMGRIVVIELFTKEVS